MSPKDPIILVCGNGKHFRSTPSLSTNSYTFMFVNKYVITTMEVLRIQQQMVLRNSLKRSQSAKELYKLS